MPAHKKRPDLRQDNRPQRAGLEVVKNQAKQTAEVNKINLTADKSWLKVTKDNWNQFWQSSVSDVVEPQDIPAVRRLFFLRDQQARAFERYAAQPYVDGSQGQPRSNPALADALQLEKAVVALEDRLALSPKARAQLGVTFGQAQLSAAELNKMHFETGESKRGAAVVEAELYEEWDEAAN